MLYVVYIFFVCFCIELYRLLRMRSDEPMVNGLTVVFYSDSRWLY